MRKLFTLFVLSPLTFIQAQSFYRNGLVINANSGIEIYNTALKVHRNHTNNDTILTDKAGSYHFAGGAEYGLFNHYGIGLSYKGNNYFVSKDSSGNGQESVRSNDILFHFNYHPIITRSFDLPVGFDVGYSNIKFSFADSLKTKLWASGIFYSFYINPKLYIGRFGFNLKLYAPFFSYPRLKSNNPDFEKEQSYKFRGSPGFGLSFGIQFRFLDAIPDPVKKQKEEEEPASE